MEENWSKFNNLKIQGIPEIRYYVVKRETLLIRLKGNCNVNVSKVQPGMLVQAIGDVINKEALTVQVYSESMETIWHKTEWKCHPIDLIPVSFLIWHLLVPVSSLEERFRLASNGEFCKNVDKLELNSTVWYCEGSNNPSTHLATVKFIGHVPEYGDGYYFGLEVQDNPNIGPCSIVQKYLPTVHSSGTFATISNINTRQTKAMDDIRNFEKNFMSNDLLKSNKTDNLFATKNKDVSKSKENVDTLQINKFSSLIDTDNNNRSARPPEYYVSNVIKVTRPNSIDQLHYNKQSYRNIKYFDPLSNSDEELDMTPIIDQQLPKTNDLRIDTCVKVLVHGETHYGVIRWIGSPEGNNTNKIMAAIELDDIHPSATDGTYQNVRYFQCSPQKAWFADLSECRQYDVAASNCYYKSYLQDFEPIQSLIVRDILPPISVGIRDLEKICGKNRGIQGHHNSCYLDATLFSMFAFTSVFDNLLSRPPNEKDCSEYTEVQKVLREEIVNPLRRELYVGADHVMKLRTLLERSSSISGLTSEEKDPEEFLTSLVAQTLNAEPFLLLSSGQDAYHYQLFVEKDERLVLPTVQQLLEQSFLTSDIKLKKVPSCFIIQMPRFGKAFKMYSKIQPTLLLDVTDIIENSPRQCTVCGKLAKFECKECYGQRGEGLESTAYCRECLDRVHKHEKRNNHKPKNIVVPPEYNFLSEHQPVPRLYLELLAVVCIETSHYVSFVKCAPGSDAEWCFFDSMADRIGEQDGYNVPEVVAFPNLPYWLSEEGAKHLSTVSDDRLLPEHAKRLLCDAYMCMYQSPSIATYKH
ncbi:ubiquitin carboxyl-terminal hydrolase CYLD [Copidosoma floridanum]|uniref:ubiquitin carboxyl-terminal hydrolase CYLD n=1 Tax=Copidosoma floridanum TaxID=29053 RepID=UPI0006C9E122|nr:ubiquitin carboxyl-terminal hydrolase CYLD [Copidosoma floridanum]